MALLIEESGTHLQDVLMKTCIVTIVRSMLSLMYHLVVTEKYLSSS